MTYWVPRLNKSGNYSVESTENEGFGAPVDTIKITRVGLPINKALYISGINYRID